MRDDDLRPLFSAEWEWIAHTEYHLMRVFAGGIGLYRFQCRERSPDGGDICLRLKGHPGLCISTNPVNIWKVKLRGSNRRP